MPKYKLILTVQDSFGMTKEVDGGTVDVDLAEALTPTDVQRIEEALPLEDYIKKAELPEELDEYATDNEVENAVKFTTDKFVTNSFGGFEVGDSVKGLTISNVLAKLLGLSDEKPGNMQPSVSPDAPEVPDTPEIPESPIGSIITNKTPMYQIDENDKIVEVAFIEPIVYNETANINDGQTGFYIIVENDEIIEAGYQHHTERKDPYYIIALPEELEVVPNGNVLLQTWSAIEDRWVTASYVLTSDYSEIVSTYEADGIEPPVAPDGYKLWADLSDSDPGTSYRFVIKE